MRRSAGESPSYLGVGAGDLVALAALDAVLHRVIDRDREAGRVDLSGAISRTEREIGSEAARSVAGAWATEFGPDPPPTSSKLRNRSKL